MKRISLENTIYVAFGRETWIRITLKIIFSFIWVVLLSENVRYRWREQLKKHLNTWSRLCKGWPRPPNRGDRLKETEIAVIKWKKIGDLTSDRFIQGGRLYSFDCINTKITINEILHNTDIYYECESRKNLRPWKDSRPRPCDFVFVPAFLGSYKKGGISMIELVNHDNNAKVILPLSLEWF